MRRRRKSPRGRSDDEPILAPLSEPPLPAAVGKKIVAVAIELIEKLYVHLPLKRSMYAINPLQRLRLLVRRLEAPGARPMSERQFYDQMLGIFCQLRDLHTSFVLPEPFHSRTVYLPFRIEMYVERGVRKYMVSSLASKATKFPGFRVGTVITHWNGVPIDLAVAANGEREAGSNPAARHARGLRAMTIRWMAQSLVPDEEWVTLTYLSGRGGRSRRAEFKWQVFQPKGGATERVARTTGDQSLYVGMDTRAEVERQVRSFLFTRRRPRGPSSRSFGDVKTIRSAAPDVFPSCRDVMTRYGTFAYVRIATFNVGDDRAFLDEFIRIVSQLSQDGLIVDVRGNGGGLIHAGERLLQLLTPRAIEPCRFHFLNTTRTQQITSVAAPLQPWNPSIAQAVETGAEFSQGLSLLPPEHYNDIGQKYQGPVVLVTDALCYSTTDIFAAGFQDNRIGTILGVDENTGAGGANVWDYDIIAKLIRDPKAVPKRLPRNASFRFAVRRVTRVGANAGVPLEDLGVRPDALHAFTRNDILKRNVNLIGHAARLLSEMPKQRLSAALLDDARVQVESKNIDKVDAYLDGHPLGSTPIRGEKPVVVAIPRTSSRKELRLHGFRKGDLVVAMRLALRV